MYTHRLTVEVAEVDSTLLRIQRFRGNLFVIFYVLVTFLSCWLTYSRATKRNYHLLSPVPFLWHQCSLSMITTLLYIFRNTLVISTYAVSCLYNNFLLPLDRKGSYEQPCWSPSTQSLFPRIRSFITANHYRCCMDHLMQRLPQATTPPGNSFRWLLHSRSPLCS